jgi:protein-tyrosine phosphatase
VTPGRFFRSSAPCRFAADEQRALTRLKLRSAIDLRTGEEVVQSGGWVFSSEVRVVHLPLFERARENWIAPADQSPRATAERYFEMLNDGMGAVAAVIGEVAQPDAAPVLVSCSAGRDRTGIVVACLLDLLDISEEAIASDYAQSDSFEQESGRAHADTIVELFALVRERYGSTQRMLARHGVTGSIQQALRNALLSERK